MLMRSLRVPAALVLTLTVPNLASAGTLVQAPAAPTAPAPAPAEMSEEEKMEKAKGLYIQAEGLAAQGNWTDAVPLYEEAYYLVPGKHGFAHKVGVAAWNVKDCNKANDYLKHFLTYGDEEKDADKFAEAKQILGEISVSGCATNDSATTTTTTTTTADVEDEENPIGMSTTEARQQENAQTQQDAKNEKRGLLIGGAVLLGVGVAGVGVGIAGLAIANSSANTLQDLSTNLTTSGFPEGDYACRGVDTAQCPFELEKRLKTGNVLGYVGLGVGGAALVGGAAMLAVYMVNKKKNGGKLESSPEGEAGVELSAFGPMLVPGGGAGAMAEIRF